VQNRLFHGGLQGGINEPARLVNFNGMVHIDGWHHKAFYAHLQACLTTAMLSLGFAPNPVYANHLPEEKNCPAY
jgi:hypothetical protein